MDRPIPIPCDLDQQFWEAAKDGRLLLQRTPSGRIQAYPRGHALDQPMTAEASLDWLEASGRGVIETFSIVRRSFYPALVAPYVFAVTRLEEGPLLTGHVVEIAPEEVSIGMLVEVVFAQIGDGAALPCFRPIGMGAKP